MRIQDAAYIAGFFDGEGCVSVQFPRSSKNGKRYPKLTARLFQNRPRVLYHIKKLMGCGSIHINSRSDGRHPNPCYVYTTTNSSARHFLSTIKPFLIVKKRETRVALERDKRLVNPK